MNLIDVIVIVVYLVVMVLAVMVIVGIASRGRQFNGVGEIDINMWPARGEFMRLSHPLVAGATGILYPGCKSSEEAAS